jgi:hypothetical protein
LGLGLFEAAIPFSALITVAWCAWMYIFLSGCVLHSTQDMAAGIHEEGWSRIDEDDKLWRRTKKVGRQETLEDLEKLLEETKEFYEKRSESLLLAG